MHDTADAIGRLFLEAYWRPEFRRILDVGAYDVNGSLRRHKPDGAEWVGIDLAAGPGVDVVLKDAWTYPFPDASFDVVVSTSTFEHDRLFWLTFLEMCRVLKPGGFIYINAPSNGNYHTYPLDCWRFYPDAGVALEAWAQRMGRPIHLIESFVAPRIADHWNDFVLVFSTAPATPSSSPVADRIPDAYNVRAGSAGPIRRHSVETEDMRIQRGLRRGLDEIGRSVQTIAERHDPGLRAARKSKAGFAVPPGSAPHGAAHWGAELFAPPTPTIAETSHDLKRWTAVNAILDLHPSVVRLVPDHPPVLSFRLTEADKDGTHWCHWSGTAPGPQQPIQVRMLLRGCGASGVRIRLICGDWSENAWISFMDFGVSRIPSQVFEVVQVEPALLDVQFSLPSCTEGAHFSVGLILLDEDTTQDYAGRRRSLSVDLLTFSHSDAADPR